jgi:hypothetical protein
MKKITYGLTKPISDLAIEHYEKINKYFNFEADIKNIANDSICPIEKAIINDIATNIKDIITATPEKLHEYATLKHDIFDSISIENKDKIKNIFIEKGYKKWRSSKKIQHWIKENLLSARACPYCNANYLSSISHTKKTNSPTKENFVYLFFHFDHFYSKEKYFYLALSFYNLIPACHTCNASLKGNKPFSIADYIHPYLHDFQDAIKFSLNLNNENLNTFLNPYHRKKSIVKISYKKNHPISLQAEKTVKLFKLVERYEEHQDYITELLQKAYTYPKDYIKNLLYRYPDIFQSENEIKRLIWGNYTQPEDINRRPLAKLTQDIMDELGLNK